jgi:hypothetical protein
VLVATETIRGNAPNHARAVVMHATSTVLSLAKLIA